ncbi:hypothetical protein BDN72DRAFT_874963 [Pluteus cervinus]|uniref:Uncharacterized protein n=1 Tax=Pluteus cervinus TaxID=181527 RepID=A0ACD3B9T4_9AGAR|nr:hypothetical protein BDN72DRAFT_874963 [Pluteus cervinus]
MEGGGANTVTEAQDSEGRRGTRDKMEPIMQRKKALQNMSIGGKPENHTTTYPDANGSSPQLKRDLQDGRPFRKPAAWCWIVPYTNSSPHLSNDPLASTTAEFRGMIDPRTKRRQQVRHTPDITNYVEGYNITEYWFRMEVQDLQVQSKLPYGKSKRTIIESWNSMVAQAQEIQIIKFPAPAPVIVQHNIHIPRVCRVRQGTRPTRRSSSNQLHVSLPAPKYYWRDRPCSCLCTLGYV